MLLRNPKIGVLAFAVTAVLSGCATSTEIKTQAKEANTVAADEAQSLLDRRKAQMGGGTSAGPIEVDLPYVNVKPVPYIKKRPAAFQRIVELDEEAGMPFSILSQRLGELTGMRVTFDPDVNNGTRAQNVDMPTPTNWSRLPQLGAGVTTRVSGGELNVAVVYKGSVAGLLDTVAATSGTAWRYEEGANSIHFYRFETKRFAVSELPGAGTSSYELGGQTVDKGGTESEGLEAASASTSYRVTIDTWGELDQGIQRLLSPNGSYSLQPSTASVLVRDIPSRMREIETYIESVNASLSTIVDVDVQIYSVILRDSDQRNVSLTGLFQKAIETSGYAATLNMTRPDFVSEGASSFILESKEFNADGTPARYGGSSVVADILSTIGESSLVTTVGATAVNNRPSPLKVVRRTAYLKESTPAFTAGNGGTTGNGLKPGVVETGLNMQVLPSVQEDGRRLVMRMMLGMTRLESMSSATSGENSINTPETSSREFDRQFWLNSGETMVVTGMQQVDTGLSTSTPFDRWMWALGGNRTATKSNEVIVVAIRPVVKAARSRI